MLRNKPKQPVVWVEPTVNRDTHTISYRIREGGTPTPGTVKRGIGTCVATGAVIPVEYTRAEGRAGRIGSQLIGIVTETAAGRVYVAPQIEEGTKTPEPAWLPTEPLPKAALGFRVQNYGLTAWHHLFTNRQLIALTTLSDLLTEARSLIEHHAETTGMPTDNIPLRDGGSGVPAYADAITTYLAFAVDKCADYWSTICSWHSSRELIRNTFARQAIPMVWDYAEANPFSSSTGNWMAMVNWVQKAVARLPASAVADVVQRDAEVRVREITDSVLSTDPPYYDNIGYADISDFFYVWLRRNLRNIWPNECSTLLTPKARGADR